MKKVMFVIVMMMIFVPGVFAQTDKRRSSVCNRPFYFRWNSRVNIFGSNADF